MGLEKAADFFSYVILRRPKKAIMRLAWNISRLITAFECNHLTIMMQEEAFMKSFAGLVYVRLLLRSPDGSWGSMSSFFSTVAESALG